MTLDTAHVGTWELDLLESLDFFDGRLANVHLSDLKAVPHWVLAQPRLHSYLRQHQFPGTGVLPLRECLQELAARGYDGPITFELSPLAIDAWLPWRVERRLRKAVQFVRSTLGQTSAPRP
jgi:sugar phosphate isomerase/epimerase